MNRTTLIERVTAGAGVSRSTAERAIRDARESSLVCCRQVGTEVLMDLSQRMFEHCIGYFRTRVGPCPGRWCRRPRAEPSA
jgi:hypothetical protein